jgi:glycosyltransferase involved in cell wall biosynthesis
MISVIIPTKNEEAFLPRLLKSLQAQTRRPDEVIIADAGSTDRTCEIARSFGARVVEGGLPGVGRNKGAEAAKGDMLVFFDADVQLVEQDFIERSLEQMQERGLDIATCDVEPLSDSHLDKVLHKAYNRYVRVCGSKLPHAAGFCIFVKADLHADIQGFDEDVKFCEDHDYARRAAKEGNFGVLDKRIPVSVRRLNRDGRLNIAVKFALAELHLITLGPIRHNKFDYQFGHNKQEVK